MKVLSYYSQLENSGNCDKYKLAVNCNNGAGLLHIDVQLHKKEEERK